jgi:hypothetical protein
VIRAGPHRDITRLAGDSPAALRLDVPNFRFGSETAGHQSATFSQWAAPIIRRDSARNGPSKITEFDGHSPLHPVTTTIQLSPITALATLVGEGRIVAFAVGPDRVTYLVIAQKELDYTIEQPGWAIFPKTVPERPQHYRVIGLSGSETVLDVKIEGERFNIHGVQPLPNELLLVCHRSHYNDGNFERNGRIYSRTGVFLREILLGDGIESVQTSSSGDIWTSFFDEGVFGNFGWKTPIGASGLIAWNAFGEQLFEYEPSGALEAICDCYALNVESDEDVWLYYYTDFPLVRLRRRKVDAYWKMPIRGSKAFAISSEHALFNGDYAERDTYQLFSLAESGQSRFLGSFELADQTGEKLIAHAVVGRADSLYLICNNFLYLLEMRTALAALA